MVARNGSPILIGISNDTIFVASEKIAFEKHTANYISLKDGEIIEIDKKNIHEFYKNQKERIQTIAIKSEVLLVPKAPFKHFFSQEIFDQPATLLATFGNGARLCTESRPKLGGLEVF